MGLLPESQAHFAPLAHGLDHRDAAELLDEAFKAGSTDPARAQALLSASVLAFARQTSEGRLSAALALLSPLVGQAPIENTLGPAGAARRQEMMPNGWRYTLVSWQRLRYAWREGLVELLDPAPGMLPVVHALDEVTRLNPAEAEPSQVVIQKVNPHQSIGLLIGGIGVALGLHSLYRSSKR